MEFKISFLEFLKKRKFFLTVPLIWDILLLLPIKQCAVGGLPKAGQVNMPDRLAGMQSEYESVAQLDRATAF